jgi:hypothetical protein
VDGVFVANLLFDFQLAFHPLVTMAGHRPKALVAIDGEGTRLHGCELHGNGFPGADVLLDGSARRQVSDDEVVRSDGSHAGQRELDRFARFHDKMAGLVRVAVEDDRRPLYSVRGERHHERGRRSGLRSGHRNAQERDRYNAARDPPASHRDAVLTDGVGTVNFPRSSRHLQRLDLFQPSLMFTSCVRMTDAFPGSGLYNHGIETPPVRIRR